MDMITLAMAKAYTDSQQLASVTKEKKVLVELKAQSNGYFEGRDATPFKPTHGKTYFVTTDSGTFPVVAEAYYSEADGYVHQLYCEGNFIYSESWDLNPIVYDDAMCLGVGARDYNGGNTFIISEEVEVVKPIDPKYLPGVCLPVVELSTVFAAGASFTAEENAKLKAAWESDTPIVIKCDLSIGSDTYTDTAAIWSKINVSGINTFGFPFGASMLQIYSMGGVENWSCNIQSVG